MLENVQLAMFEETSSLDATTRYGGEDFVAAFLSVEDFEIARTFVGGFERWPSYDDFALDANGMVMGMAMAGKSSFLLTISLDAFKDWLRDSGESPTLDALNNFAQTLHDFRSAPSSKFTVPPAAHSETALDHYGEWLEALQSLDSLRLWELPPGPETYAELLLECWSS